MDKKAATAEFRKDLLKNATYNGMGGGDLTDFIKEEGRIWRETSTGKNLFANKQCSILVVTANFGSASAPHEPNSLSCINNNNTILSVGLFAREHHTAKRVLIWLLLPNFGSIGKTHNTTQPPVHAVPFCLDIKQTSKNQHNITYAIFSKVLESEEKVQKFFLVQKKKEIF